MSAVASPTRSSPWIPEGAGRALPQPTSTTRSGRPSREWIAPGEIGVLETFAVGDPSWAQTCYDLRFPEVTRWLVDAGAGCRRRARRVGQGPLMRRTGARSSPHGRSENTIYLVAADQTPPIGVGEQHDRLI